MKTRLFTLAVVLGSFFLFGKAVQAQDCSPPTPTFVEGNPSCCINDDGYAGYKIDPPNAGTYSLTGAGITCNPGGFSGNPNNQITIVTDGVYFSFTSNFPIERMYAKGGPNANLYEFDPPAFCGDNLSSPINPGTGQPYGLSHIEFCFGAGYLLNATVSKDAMTEWTRTYTWDIEKSVSPDSWDLFTGDQASSLFTVEVDQAVTDGPYEVSGSITAANLENTPVTIYGISDVITGYGDPIPVTPSCGVTFPYLLAAQSELICTYTAMVPTGTGGTNTATVYFSSDLSVFLTAVAAVTFSAEPTTVTGYPTINVEDTNGDSWSFSGDGSASYTESFTCDGDEGIYDNTATILETGQSASASVTVNCYALDVTKDASTSYDRQYDWEIVKTGDQTDLTLAEGQTFSVNYEVTVTGGNTDSDWAVEGSISIYNPAPMDATINSVSDIITPDIAATCDCGVSFPYTLAAGETLLCTYSADLPDGSGRTNTATATLQNFSYDAEGEGTPSGTSDFTGSASVTFGDPANVYDECIDVSDDQTGFLGTVCDGDEFTFTYSLLVGPYDVCGEYTYVNTASFVTNDQGATGSSSWTVNIDVPCGGGCTLTPGYWKTHSEFGPAPYDDNWAQLPNGASTTFYLSGKTYYQVLWTAPQGKAYYILAHSFIAAYLNVLNGSTTTPEVDAAMAWAVSFFSTYTPSSTLSKAVRNQAIAYATTLDNYNNGLIGPGHCSEEGGNGDYQSALASGDDAEISMSSMLNVFPNPVSSTTNFVINLQVESRVELTMYSPVGQKVATIYSGTLAKGQHSLQFTPPAQLPNGIYIVTLVASGERVVSRLSLAR